MAVSNRNNSSWSGSAVATLAIGFAIVAVGLEALAAYNSCIADPACLPSAGDLNVAAFFAVLVVGIGITVGGALAGTRKVAPTEGSTVTAFPP